MCSASDWSTGLFFFPFPSFDPTDLSIFNVSYAFVPFSSASSLSTTVPLFYSITSLFHSLSADLAIDTAVQPAAPPPSRPPEANDLARRSALSSPLLAPPLFPSGAYQKTETLSTTN
jgi:hypothetical protein